MPAGDRVWLDDDQGLAPLPRGLGEQDPKESVACAKLWAFDGALQSSELLTKRQVSRATAR